MSTLDQFASAFKSAAKAVFQPAPVRFAHAMVVTDRQPDETRLFADRVGAFLNGTAAPAGEVEWIEADRTLGDTVGALLEKVEAVRPDLVCTYRNLHTGAWRWPHTLGDPLEVLTQATSMPVLVLPRLDDEAAWKAGVRNTDRVMAMTDRLTGDDHLVNVAAACTLSAGHLHLTHIEDAAAFERFIDAVSKVSLLLGAVCGWGVIAILGSSLFHVDVTSRAGLFTWIAIKLTETSRGDPLKLLWYYGLMTVLFSAVLNDVMEHAQVLALIGEGLQHIVDLGPTAGSGTLLIASAGFSSVTDNIPLAAMLSKILGGPGHGLGLAAVVVGGLRRQPRRQPDPHRLGLDAGGGDPHPQEQAASLVHRLRQAGGDLRGHPTRPGDGVRAALPALKRPEVRGGCRFGTPCLPVRGLRVGSHSHFVRPRGGM